MKLRSRKLREVLRHLSSSWHVAQVLAKCSELRHVGPEASVSRPAASLWVWPLVTHGLGFFVGPCGLCIMSVGLWNFPVRNVCNTCNQVGCVLRDTFLLIALHALRVVLFINERAETAVGEVQ